MKPQLRDDDVAQYKDLLQRLTRLEQGVVEPMHYLGAAGEPALQNGWVNYDANRAAGFYRAYGRCHLIGVVKNGTVGLATPILTLPVGYRPVGVGDWIGFATSANQAIGEISVHPNGSVALWFGSNVYAQLNTVSFRCA